jgi:DNA repair exonuclease SbcCD nuclease subunit
MEIIGKRAIIISDTHLGARSNSMEWLDMMKDWFYEDFIVKVKEIYQPGDILIHCGDVFDNRQSVNLLVLHEGIRLFEELSRIFVDGIYVIAGNHDVMRKTTNDVSSLDCLKYIPNVNIIKEPILVKIQNSNCLFMPWRADDKEERSCLESYSKSNLHYLFCHTNIRSLKFDNSRDVEEGLDASELKSFIRVYSGHIHWGQSTKNIVMIGNPYQMTRSDGGNKKGWYLLDFETDEQTFFENEYSPKFVRLYLNKFLDKSIGDLKALCNNNRVDLFVPSSFLIKYQITPIIDILSQITKKLEVIPFEDESLDLEFDHDEAQESFNIFGLCEKHVKRMSNIDNTMKDRVISKINNLYSNILKETRE